MSLKFLKIFCHLKMLLYFHYCYRKLCMLFFQISAAECAGLEINTRRQSYCNEWAQHRAGRITASNMYRVLHTDPFSPAPSLVKDICGLSTFTSKATSYGKCHEKKAKKLYVSQKSCQHTKLR